MATWKEVISNLSSYPDDLKIKVAEGVEIPLGELRMASKSEMAELEKQRKEMAKRQAEIDAATLRVAEMYSKGELTTEQVAAASAAVAAPPQEYNYDADQYVGPIYKEVKSLKDVLKATKEQNDLLRNQLAGLSASITTDRYARDYEEALTPDDRKLLGDSPLPDFDSTIRFAQENGLVDPRRRTLNIKKAVRDMVAPTMEAARLKAAEARGREAGLQEATSKAAAANAVRPNRLGKQQRTVPEVNGKQIKTLDDAMNAAAQDPEIAGALSNIGSIQ